MLPEGMIDKDGWCPFGSTDQRRDDGSNNRGFGGDDDVIMSVGNTHSPPQKRRRCVPAEVPDVDMEDSASGSVSAKELQRMRNRRFEVIFPMVDLLADRWRSIERMLRKTQTRNRRTKQKRVIVEMSAEQDFFFEFIATSLTDTVSVDDVIQALQKKNQEGLRRRERGGMKIEREEERENEGKGEGEGNESWYPFAVPLSKPLSNGEQGGVERGAFRAGVVETVASLQEIIEEASSSSSPSSSPILPPLYSFPTVPSPTHQPNLATMFLIGEKKGGIQVDAVGNREAQEKDHQEEFEFLFDSITDLLSLMYYIYKKDGSKLKSDDEFKNVIFSFFPSLF